MTENIPKKAGGNQDFRRQAHSYCMVTAKAAEIQTLKQQNDSLAERLNELEATVKQVAANK
jgi:cell division protein FtsB